MDNDEAYDSRYLKMLLKDHYISFSEQLGRETLIYVLDMASFIINNKFRERKDDIQEESRRIIEAAANLIRAEIREKQYDSSSYPTTEEITSPWIPDSLRIFMASFTKSTLKYESIGKCIIKVASPMKIPPILFALGVEVDHIYRSKWLNDELFKLGFSVSYCEVTRFKHNIKQISTENSFTQFITSNADHNTATLDGRGSFHGISIISSTVSSSQSVTKDLQIKRPDKLLKVEELTSKATDVSITAYDFPQSENFDSILFKPSLGLLYPCVLPETLNAEILWHAASINSTKDNLRPNWPGYMQKLIHAGNQEKATITLVT